jgi:hypothetical protein
MERIPVCLIAAFCMGLSHPAFAQLGANWFSKPAISEAVNPVVGKGGQYQTTRPNQKDATPELQEFTVVGRESVDGKDGFWVEISRQGKGDSGMVYAKILFTKDDFQFHKIVVQQPGQQAIAMPFQPSDKTKTHMSEEAEKWHAVGAESITVPAGTFSCKHWKKDNSAGDTGDSDIWTSEKISPFGIVKQATPAQTMVLVKVITDAQDHITGPVKTFDPDEMKRQMMEKMQQQKPQKP